MGNLGSFYSVLNIIIIIKSLLYVSSITTIVFYFELPYNYHNFSENCFNPLMPGGNKKVTHT